MDEMEKVASAVREVVMIVRHIVNNPEAVRVDIRQGKYRMAVDLHTHPSDVGQVVGRNAHLISSIRAFLSAVAGKNKIKIDLDFVTEEDNKRSQSERT